MNRAIKFRAWDASRKEYLSGGAVFIEVLYGRLPNQGKTFLDSCHPHYETQDRFVLQQYTGLKDKNGKEVYDGDICRVELASAIDMADPDPSMRVIQFCQVEARLTHFWIDGKPAGTGYTFCRQNVEKLYEVIGNIYEDPELLE